MRYFSENDIDLNHLIQHDKQGNMKTLPGTFNVNDYPLVSRKNCIMHLAWHFKWYCVEGVRKCDISRKMTLI